MSKRRSEPEILELLLLTLTWVQSEPGGAMCGWSGNSLLHTMQMAGAVDPSQYRHISSGNDKELHAYLVARTRRVWLKGRPFGVRLAKEAISKLNEPLICLVNTGVFFGDKLVTPRGYRLYATERGMELAQDAAPRYRSILTQNAFWPHWDRRRRQMRGMYAALKDT